MRYLPPFAILGTHRLSDSDLEVHAAQFLQLLSDLSAGRKDLDMLEKQEFLNDIYTGSTPRIS
jgi:glutathione-regulated potassium-efflux system ancillary protein KefG